MGKGNASRRIKQILVFLQTGWSIVGITLIVLLLTEIGFRALFTIRDRLSAEPLPDRRVLDEGYDRATWPVAHYRELESLEDRWQPYVYFRQKPFRGKTIAIGSDGLRATWQPPSRPPIDDRPRVRLLMLGGSSLWGFGARDDETIPSLLARQLDQRGWRVELKNLSEIGYVSTQELIALVRELQAGYRPDVVIFYDGVNDTTSALLEGEAGLTTNEVNRRQEFNLLQSPARLSAALISKLVKDSGSYRFAQVVRRRSSGDLNPSRSSPTDQTMRALAAGVVQHYVANIAIAEKLGRGFGFRPLFYWQPVVFTKPAQVPFEREETVKYAWAEGIFREVYGKIRDSAELKVDPAFRDLSRLFDDSRNLIFIDYCHTTESANARIAAEMAGGVIETLQRPLPDSRKPDRDDSGPGQKGVE
jgi:lysophospholipase L1-like esterase